MNEGIVYVLTNPAMLCMVKIGKTGREVEARLNDLYTRGVPLPFECANAARVADMDKVEKAFHNVFCPYRVNPRWEFFSIEPEQTIGLVVLMKLEDMTPLMQAEAEEVDVEAKALIERLKRARRLLLNYLEMGSMLATTLLYEGDGQTTCTVVAGRNVSFEGRNLLISKLTAELRAEPDRAIRGPVHWSFNGQLANFMRKHTLTTNLYATLWLEYA